MSVRLIGEMLWALMRLLMLLVLLLLRVLLLLLLLLLTVKLQKTTMLLLHALLLLDSVGVHHHTHFLCDGLRRTAAWSDAVGLHLSLRHASKCALNTAHRTRWHATRPMPLHTIRLLAGYSTMWPPLSRRGAHLTVSMRQRRDHRGLPIGGTSHGGTRLRRDCSVHSLLLRILLH